MSAHTCRTLTDGCYRCDLNRDEIEAAQADVRAEAQAAWLEYADGRRFGAESLLRQIFIAGYLAANDMTEFDR